MTSIIVNSEHLIKAVKKYPCIWNAASKDFNVKIKKNECWNRICEEVFGNDWGKSKEENLLRKNELKKKWLNIRDYHKKLKDADKKARLGLAPRRRRKYIFANLLDFLEPDQDGDRPAPIYEEYLEEDSWAQDYSSEEQEDKKNPDILSLENPVVRTEETFIEPSEDDADLMFFKSLLPDMKRLTESQKFDFKLGVMQLYKTIKRRRSSED